MTTSSDKRAEYLKELGMLASGLAHEIKNPLGTINNHLQLLREDWEDVETEKARRTIRRIDLLLRESKRLQAMVETFQSLAQGHKLNLAEYDLNEFLDDVLDFMEPRAKDARVTIRRGLTPGLPRLEFDWALMRQAVINILKNGIEAMPNGGELIVRTQRAEDMLRIDIADTGEGIPPEKAEKIFRPYYSTKKAGSGIGLPTTRRIIMDHGGEIFFTSEPGKGTNFTIRLPLRREDSSQQQ